MASNFFARYIWLVDVIKRHRQGITFKRINELWKQSGLSYGETDELPLRTFHNHIVAITDMFGIDIECDKKHGFRYYIGNPEKLENDSLRTWLIESYATLNQVRADEKLEERIIFEDIPSGHEWLTTIADAMRHNQVLTVTHQGYEKPEPSTFDIEPYCLKVFNRRWYVLARSPYYSERNKKKGIKPEDVYLLYALDRLLDVEPTDKTFKMKKGFSIDKYFEGCYGVITEKDKKIERIVLKAWYPHCAYMESLPLHPSQRIIARDDESITFELYVRPTFDFYQALLAQTDMMEVLEPSDVRKEMKRFTENMLNHYKND